MRNMARRIYDIILSKMRKNSVAPMKLFDIVVRKKKSDVTLKKN